MQVKAVYYFVNDNMFQLKYTNGVLSSKRNMYELDNPTPDVIAAACVAVIYPETWVQVEGD